METYQYMAMAPSPSTGTSSGSKTAADPMSGIISFLPLVLIFVLFYVLFIMPQRKQQKQHEQLLKTLKKGDEVITTGGMFGTIVGINERENTVFLKMGESVKIEMQRSAISGLRKIPAPESQPTISKK